MWRTLSVLLAVILVLGPWAQRAGAHDAPGSTSYDLQVPSMPLGGALTQVLLIGPAAGSEVLHTTWHLTFSSPPGGTPASEVLLELSVQLESGGKDWVISGAELGWPSATGTHSGTLDSDILNGVLASGLGGISTPELFLWSTGGGVTGQYLASTIELELAGSNCQADLGFGGPGNVALSLCGEPLASGQSGTLALSGAPAFAPMLLALNTGANPTPFKGGLLVPVPILLGIPLAANAAGGLTLGVHGGGGPVSVVLQMMVADGAQPAGVALSNALQVDLLP
jgi:hypothetical protein